MFEQCYPVRGVVDPLGVLLGLQGMQREDAKNVFLTFRTPYLYDRGAENFEAMDVVLELVEEFCKRPAVGAIAALERLKEVCGRWGGGDGLFDALVELHGALEHFRAAVPRVFYLAVNGGVSMRYITRPLLAVPEALSREEESYFLSHIFNVSVEDARRDYLDVHGGSWTGYLPSEGTDPRVEAMKGARVRLEKACGILERVGAAREGFVGRMALGLRMYCSFMRSAGNFYAAGVIRKRNPALRDRVAQVRDKQASWGGDSDLMLLNEIQRDEFNNVEELIEMLGNGGLELIVRAEKAEDEDVFLLGPELMEQLAAKRRLMRAHWLDAQGILAPPMK
jgi:hypothetical protein